MALHLVGVMKDLDFYIRITTSEVFHLLEGIVRTPSVCNDKFEFVDRIIPIQQSLDTA